MDWPRRRTSSKPSRFWTWWSHRVIRHRVAAAVLGLAILGQRLPAESVPRANAWYLAINCVGSLIGPTFTGALMDRLGKGAMFGAGQAAVLSVVAIWALLAGYDLWRSRRSRPEITAALETRAAA